MNKSSIRVMLFILPIYLVFAARPVRAQVGQRYYLCESSRLSLALPKGVPDGITSPVFFVSTRLKDSSGGLTFQNHFQRNILAVELLIQYLDEDDIPLVQIPYIAATAKAQERFGGHLRSEITKVLKKGISPGKSLYMIGESFTLVNRCPAKAKLAFLHILFEDSQTAEWKMDEWETKPLIKQIPETVEFSCGSQDLTVDRYFRLGISSTGRVSKIQPPEARHWVCLDSLRQAFESWTFYPALRNGNPCDSELDILIRFHRDDRKKKKKYGWVSSQEIRGPTVVVDFVQDNAAPTKWIIFFGPHPFGIIAN